MASFRTKVRQLACHPWAYSKNQDKSPPARLPPLGLWQVSRQKSANPPATLGPISSFSTKVRQPACHLWAHSKFQDKSPPARLPPLGLYQVSGQKPASWPATLGPIAGFRTKVRQLACPPWAYSKNQDKSPPTLLPPLGLYQVSRQKSASLPATLGPIAGFKTKARQLACHPWAYGKFQDKSPPTRLPPLGL